MQSWASVEVPALPGRAGELRLFDTGRRGLVPVTPADGTARLYVCGITPYDATHLGHAATYLSFDTLVRVWRDQGLDVRYAQNVTDIDDPLLERADKLGIDWRELAERETELFRTDMTALRILPPTSYVGAVEAMPEIIRTVERLAAADAAYHLPNEDDPTVSDPDSVDIYFPVEAAPHFGRVAGLPQDEMIALSRERGGDPDRTGKEDPLDGLLWRAERKGEPAWPSALGPGRPGWHVECTAIALAELGERIDVQGGGSDLAFPHHEHSVACAEVLTGHWPYAAANVHAGQIGLDGHKMSKSLGNLVLVSQLRQEGVDPAAVRLALLADHYRSDREWTTEMLANGRARQAYWQHAVRRASGPAGEEVLAQVRAALATDLNTPAALAAVDAWCAAEGDDTAAPTLVRDLVDALLGVSLRRDDLAPDLVDEASTDAGAGPRPAPGADEPTARRRGVRRKQVDLDTAPRARALGSSAHGGALPGAAGGTDTLTRAPAQVGAPDLIVLSDRIELEVVPTGSAASTAAGTPAAAPPASPVEPVPEPVTAPELVTSPEVTAAPEGTGLLQGRRHEARRQRRRRRQRAFALQVLCALVILGVGLPIVLALR